MSGEEALRVGGSDGGSEGEREGEVAASRTAATFSPAGAHRRKAARKHARRGHATTIVALSQHSQFTERNSRGGTAAI